MRQYDEHFPTMEALFPNGDKLKIFHQPLILLLHRDGRGQMRLPPYVSASLS